MSAAIRKWLPWGLCVLGLVLLVASRVLVESSRELAAGQRAVVSGDVPEGVRHLRRAAHWYLPGNPYSARAYERLEAVAAQAESQGRTADASAAWRAIRSSALATRWLVVPERERLARANRHLAALMLEGPSSPAAQDRDRAHEREAQLALLSEDHAPEPIWIVVMGVGFAAWLAAAFWAARHGWDDEDRPRARALLAATASVVVGFGLFVLGLVRA